MRPLLPLNQNEALLRRALETAEETIRLLTLENAALKRLLEPHLQKEADMDYGAQKEVWRDGW